MTKWDYIGVIDYGKYYGNTNYPIDFELAGKYIDPTFSEKNDFYISHDGNFVFMTCNS